MNRGAFRWLTAGLSIASSLLPALVLATLPASAAPAPVRVKASPVVADCLNRSRALYEKASGVRFTVEAGPVERAHAADGFDVVVGAEEETTRLVEGGAADATSEVVLAKVPWVLLGGAGDVRSLANPRGRVFVPGGEAALAVRRSLQHVPAERVLTLSPQAAPPHPADGDLALVPRTLAGSQRATELKTLPPLLVHGFLVRGTADAAGGRRLLQALAEDGLSACGTGR